LWCCDLVWLMTSLQTLQILYGKRSFVPPRLSYLLMLSVFRYYVEK